MRDSRLSQELRDGRVSFSPARIEVTADDPIKVEQAGKDRSAEPDAAAQAAVRRRARHR